MNSSISLRYMIKYLIKQTFADGHYNLHKVCFCKYAVLLCQSLSITEAAITGGDKSEHTQSTLSLLLQCFYIIHMIACVTNFGENVSNSFDYIFPFSLLVFFFFYQLFFVTLLHHNSSCQKCVQYWLKLETCPILHPVHLSNIATTRHMDL